MRRGILHAAAAYTLWGLFPLYFRAVREIAPLEITAHRVLWSLLFMLVVMLALRRWDWIGPALRSPRVRWVFVGSATLLAVNWFIYVVAVTHGKVVEASLGYFINPLVNVLLGRLVLGERLRRGQWAAVALATAGVTWLTWHQGAPPWIALSLAATFGTYGLLRKTAPLGALEGLTLESLVLAPLAIAGLAWFGWQGQTGFQHADAPLQWLLIAAGPLTAIPLLLFGSAARRIPLSLLGMLQYIGPTLQLLLGVWLFGEAFGGARAQGFIVIWCACGVFSADLWWHSRRPASA
ncbi:MAG: EamA family transporter RarD [Leptothrix sp. (in: b-proteobacteria)]